MESAQKPKMASFLFFKCSVLIIPCFFLFGNNLTIIEIDMVCVRHFLIQTIETSFTLILNLYVDFTIAT